MNSNMEKPYVVGIDIGGTNTVFGIVDARGTIIASSSIKTAGYPTAEEYADEVCKNLLPLIMLMAVSIRSEVSVWVLRMVTTIRELLNSLQTCLGEGFFRWLLCLKKDWVFLRL